MDVMFTRLFDNLRVLKSPHVLFVVAVLFLLCGVRTLQTGRRTESLRCWSTVLYRWTQGESQLSDSWGSQNLVNDIVGLVKAGLDCVYMNLLIVVAQYVCISSVLTHGLFPCIPSTHWQTHQTSVCSSHYTCVSRSVWSPPSRTCTSTQTVSRRPRRRWGENYSLN